MRSEVLFSKLLGAALVGLAAGLTHDDLVALNASCSQEGFCSGGADWSIERCHCDELCAEFGDCCPDAINYNLEEQTLPERYKCVTATDEGGFYMKGECTEDWQGTEVDKLCQTGSPADIASSRDPLAHLPVTSNTSSITYTNYYCAICNKDSLELNPWTIEVVCSSPFEGTMNLTQEHIASNLVFENDTWWIFVPYNGINISINCDVRLPYPPESARSCLPTIIDTCAEGWNDLSIEILCHSYTAQRFADGLSYRNPHCVLCNFIPLEKEACAPWVYSVPRDFNIHDFSLLVDFVDSSGSNNVGITSVCQPGEIHDPFFKKCRKIMCANANQSHTSERCGKLEGSQVGETTDSSTDAPVAPHIMTNVSVTDKVSNKSSKALECEKIFLSYDEFTLYENKTVFVEPYGRHYLVEEYMVREGGVLVCSPLTPTEKFSQIMGWVTLTGLGLSCVCLLLHLTAFLLVPHLRNLPGKSMASLCLSLFGAYTTFIISAFVRQKTRECYILGAAMYYLFLASFFWMSIMAFDVWYTFHQAKKQLRVSSGRQRNKFLAYSVYSWLFPALALVVMVTLDLTAPPDLPPEFLPSLGQRWCWFGQRKALMVFFTAPLFAVMVINVIFFIATAYVIRTNTESTLQTSSCSDYKKQLQLYVRLAVLMGFTWITGIVAGYVQLELLWYIFVLLNTLQGVFIFLAFTCRSKVWRAVRDLWQRGRPADGCLRPNLGVLSTEQSQESSGIDNSQISVHTESTNL